LVRDVSTYAEGVVTFVGRQLLNVFAPAIFLCSNPEVL
jgi:hypothetical protein